MPKPEAPTGGRGSGASCGNEAFGLVRSGMMRDNAIRARSKRKYKATTDSNHGLPVSDNLLNRDFQPERPDLVWTGDITYIATQEGWLYLAVVIDLFSRQVVGWAMGKRMTPGHRCPDHGVVQTPTG